jgi:serine/threonine protein kinase HipA of HipAB toxin-antitoxin module
MMIDEVAPQSSIEWLWTIDLIELSWDVVRYRSLRAKVLEVYREAAVESLLQRVDSLGIPPAAQEMAQRRTRRNVEQWREDPTAAAEIEARLKSKGIDAASINIEVFLQARDLFVMFDSMMHSAQRR